MRDNREKHFATNGILNGINIGTTFSSPISHAKDSLDESHSVNKFQVFRELIENYLCSDCDLSFNNHTVSPSVVPESSLGGDTTHFFSSKDSEGVDCLYSEEKVREKYCGS